MRHRNYKLGFVLVCVLLGLTVGPMVGSASGGVTQSAVVDSEITTAYEGVDDGTQTINVAATFTANEDLSGLEISISPTDNSFVDYSSIEPSVRGEGVDISSTGQGVYEIEELSAGQSVTIELDAYPRVLDQESLDVTSFELTAENPRTFEQSETATADLSNSPHLQYEQVQSELEERNMFDTVGFAGFAGGIGFGLIGLIAAGVMYSRRTTLADDAYESVVDDLEQFRMGMNDNADKNELDNYISNYKEKIDTNESSDIDASDESGTDDPIEGDSEAGDKIEL